MNKVKSFIIYNGFKPIEHYKKTDCYYKIRLKPQDEYTRFIPLKVNDNLYFTLGKRIEI